MYPANPFPKPLSHLHIPQLAVTITLDRHDATIRPMSRWPTIVRLSRHDHWHCRFVKNSHDTPNNRNDRSKLINDFPSAAKYANMSAVHPTSARANTVESMMFLSSPRIGGTDQTSNMAITPKHANPTFSWPPYIQTGGSHRPGPTLYCPCPPGRPWSASRRLPTPPGPGREAVVMSEARHVPNTAPIDPRLASASKIYTIERMISVYYAER